MEITAGNKTAIIVGASGLVGGYCIDYLLAHSAYSKVISLGRSILDIENPKLEQHKVDFNRYLSFESYIKGDDLFICLGTTMAKAGSKEAFRKVDYNYIVDVARAGATNEINQVLLISSVGSNKNSLVYYNQIKGETEEAIKALNYWSTHIFQPSLLLGKRPENRIGESVAKVLGKGLDFILGGLLTKYKPVEAKTVAKSMVAAAQNLESGIFIYPSHFLQKIAEKEDMIRQRIK